MSPNPDMRWSARKRGGLSPIGLDIGRCGLRAAQIDTRGRARGETPRIRTACWAWPQTRAAGSFAEFAAGSAGGQGGDLAVRLRRLLRQHEFRGRVVVIGLSSPEVELHALELPVAASSVSIRDMRQAARWELERLMSFDKEEVECDYWPLPPSRATPTTALGVAARKQDVEAAGHLCRSAGLECRRIDAGVCALARFGVWSRSLARATPAGDIWGVLDLGQRQSRLVLCLQATPVVVRAFDTGCQKWIQLLADALGLTPEAAEVHLHDHGLQTVGRGVRAHDPAAPSAQLGGIIRNVLRPELEPLCQEIERSYRYALQCYPDHASGELLLAGGGSEIRNLASFFAERLGIAVCTASERWTAVLPASVGGLAGRAMPGVLACAVGLAVEPGDDA